MAKNIPLTVKVFEEILDRKFQEKLAPFATTKDVERIVETMLDEKLVNYVTKDYLDQKFDEKLSPYATREEVKTMVNEGTERILKELRTFDEDRAILRGLQLKVNDLVSIHPDNKHPLPQQFTA